MAEGVVVSSPEKTYLPALDGIRGLAILMVFSCHYGDLSNSHSSLIRYLNLVKGAGWLGVDLFFALSGFLITGILWRTRSQPNRAKNFYVRRMLRLFPIYYGVWAVLILYILSTHLPWKNAYWGYLFYLGNIACAHVSSVGPFLTDHLWSLAVEEQFYVVWSFLLWRCSTVRSAVRVLIGMFCFSVALKALIALALVPDCGIYHSLPTHMEALACGGLAAFAYNEWSVARSQEIARISLPLSLVGLMWAFLYFNGFLRGGPVMYLVTFPLAAIASTTLILRALATNTLVHRLMNNSVLRLYGKYSYGLYIYHVLLRQTVKRIFYPMFIGNMHSSIVSGAAYFVFCLMFLTALSVLSFQLYEAPFLRLKQYFSC